MLLVSSLFRTVKNCRVFLAVLYNNPFPCELPGKFRTHHRTVTHAEISNEIENAVVSDKFSILCGLRITQRLSFDASIPYI